MSHQPSAPRPHTSGPRRTRTVAKKSKGNAAVAVIDTVAKAIQENVGYKVSTDKYGTKNIEVYRKKNSKGEKLTFEESSAKASLSIPKKLPNGERNGDIGLKAKAGGYEANTKISRSETKPHRSERTRYPSD